MRNNHRVGAVILGGSGHSLSAAHNLACHGVPVCVIDSALCVARFSRSVQQFLKRPALADDAAVIEFLENAALEHRLEGWVLFPSTDEDVRLIAQNWMRLSKHYRLTTPPWKSVQYWYDKRLTHQLALQRDIPVPDTYNPRSLAEVNALDAEFPVVLKPALGKQFMARTRKKAFRADTKQEMLDLYSAMAQIINPEEILVQELIPGRGSRLYSYAGLFKDNAPVAGVSARRLRQHPMDFGRASTYVVCADIPQLPQLATRLLADTGFYGLAEVEFMYDDRHGRFELLEVNPRIWGWHGLAAHAGIQLPFMAYAEAIGETYSVGHMRADARWVRLITDVPTAVSEILAGRLTAREYLSSLTGNTEFALLSLRDPLPFVAEVVLAPYNYLMGRGF